MAKTLWDQFFVHYGFPEKIFSNQGRNFESHLICELCKLTQVKKLKKRLENAFQKANAFCEKEAVRSKQHFERTAKCSKLLPGDLVLVRRKGFTSKHKIADKCESEPYEIVSQHSDGLPVYTVMRNNRERILHHNMLFPLGLRHDTGSVLDNIDESENSGNPVSEQVDNFPTNDDKVDQPIYEGPQTQSHTRNLMKANILMNQMFNIQESSSDIIPIPHESIHDLILEFWYQQIFTVYMVCCDLTEAGTHSFNC